MFKFVAGLLILWSLQLCAAASEQEHIRVVLEIAPPHQTLINGQIGGTATDAIRELFSKAQLTPAFEVYPWARAIHIAQISPNVMIFNMARTKEREQQFVWIGPIVRHHFGLAKLAKRHDIHIDKLMDLHRYTVGVQRDDFIAKWLRDEVKQPVQKMPMQADVMDTWRLLVKGKIDLLIYDPNASADVLAELQLKAADLEFVYFPEALAVTNWIALQKDSDPKLIQRLKAAYQQIGDSPAYRHVMQLPAIQQ